MANGSGMLFSLSGAARSTRQAERVYISILPRIESIARKIRNISANTIKLYILFMNTSFLPLPGVGNPDIGVTRQKYIGEGSI